MPRTRPPAPPGQRLCPRCSSLKPLEDFSADASRTDGLRSCCRACDAARQKARYWTKERKAAAKARKAASERRALERKHGRLWLAHQERLAREEQERIAALELQWSRGKAKDRFFARRRSRSAKS